MPAQFADRAARFVFGAQGDEEGNGLPPVRGGRTLRDRHRQPRLRRTPGPHALEDPRPARAVHRVAAGGRELSLDLVERPEEGTRGAEAGIAPQRGAKIGTGRPEIEPVELHDRRIRPERS